MSALNTPGQDDLQHAQQDPQQQLQVTPQLTADLNAGGQQGQNGDTTPLSEGSRKRESLPARPVQRATHPGRLQPRPPQSAGPAPPAMRARRDAARSSLARCVRRRTIFRNGCRPLTIAVVVVTELSQARLRRDLRIPRPRCRPPADPVPWYVALECWRPVGCELTGT